MVVSVTDAVIAGTSTPNWPWKLTRANGMVRFSGLCVSTSGSKKPFQMPSAM